MVVSVSSSGRITVEGQAVKVDKLAATLKSLGANSNTHIFIHMPNEHSLPLRNAIAGNLAAGKLTKYVFVMPEKVEVELEQSSSETEPAPTKPAPAPVKATPKKTTKPLAR